MRILHTQLLYMFKGVLLPQVLPVKCTLQLYCMSTLYINQSSLNVRQIFCDLSGKKNN
jgi:hypothetical protein